MSFYISDALKGRIDEESISETEEPRDIKKANFLEKLYLEIELDEAKFCMPIISIKKEGNASILEIAMPDNEILFKKTLELSKSNKRNVYLTSTNQEMSDIHLFSFDNERIELVEVRQSLLGYNYLATIVIHNCIVF